MESSNSVESHKGWLALWGANVPGKVKIHVWRLLKNGLAVGAELHNRRIKGGVNCVACGREETALHRFWQCPHAQQIWSYIRTRGEAEIAYPPVHVHSQQELLLWMLDWLGGAKDTAIETTMMMLYQGWLARNDARDDSRIEDPVSIAQRSLHLMDEWRNIQSHGSSPVPKPRGLSEHWLPPEWDWIKVNVDGAMAKHLDKGGGGVVICDHDGHFLVGAGHFLPSLLDPEDAELRACKMAMGLIRRLKLTQVVLETDNMGVVSKLSSDEWDRSLYGPMVEEIKAAIKELDDCSIKWARRTANMAANVLAKESCGSESSNTWFLVPPGSIQAILTRDMCGN